MKLPVIGKAKTRLKGPSPGSGDNYGVGVKNKVGKMRSGSVGIVPLGKKKLGIPPKSVV